MFFLLQREEGEQHSIAGRSNCLPGSDERKLVSIAHTAHYAQKPTGSR